jgi:hypothetical protein
MSGGRWRPGDIVVLRYVETPTSARMVHAIIGDPALIRGYPFLRSGEIVTVAARTYRVLEDSDQVVALFQPEGTPMPRWSFDDEEFVEPASTSRGETLRLLYPGRPYDVTLFFESAGEPPWYYDALYEGDGLRDGWRERRSTEGGSLFEPPGRPGETGRFRGWYVNVQTPFRRMPYGFDVADMTLDVVVRPDRSWYRKDEDELAMALAAGACSEAQAVELRRAVEEVVALIKSGAEPFDESWRRWLPFPREPLGEPPEGWRVPPSMEPNWPIVS